ncbi:NUDIX domain-containing protein [Streptomyces virginiae]|uniref:NUDIX domain-containing protein n=1 Tax=Streptomyces virginiae TaxID=1961 RepID=UPI0033BE0153
MTNATAERPLHSVSVAGIVVRDDGLVLVIRRADNGAWEPPGGILERSERPEEGVLREVAEETGITVEVERLTGVYKNLTLGVIALVFRCRPVGGEERLSSESTAVCWLSPDEVAESMNEAFAVRVTDALDSVTPQVRSHDGVRLLTA